MSDYTASIDTIEKALCQRYNIPALEDDLAQAVAAARKGDVAPLAAALDGRVLFRWQGVIETALAAAQGFGSEDEPAPEKSINRMNRGELVALAAGRGIEVPEDATVAILRELLAEASAEVEGTEAEPEAELSNEAETEEEPNGAHF